MDYTDNIFLFLFPVVVIASLLFRGSPRIKEWFIVLISIFILCSWGAFTVGVFACSVSINYMLILALGTFAKETIRLGIFLLIVALNISMLGLFKYEPFFATNLNNFLSIAAPIYSFAKPLGISFYTFHLISYAADIYREKLKPARFRQFIFYLCFFPHVIAGPIVRGWQLLPQLGIIRGRKHDFIFGLHLFAFGFFLKVFGGDNIGRFIDPVLLSPSRQLSALECWAVAILYYCQIYSDFAGYSLLAIGMSRLLGYHLPANFRVPMTACSLRDFWRRWHMTLSRWLRDYLYIPLGGSHGIFVQTAASLTVTMTLAGLWHGASWGFIIWGALHGFGLTLEHAARRLQISKYVPVLLGWIVTQSCVAIFFIFFRVPDSAYAFEFISKMILIFEPQQWRLGKSIAVAFYFAIPAVLHQFTPLLLKKSQSLAFPIITGGSTAIFLIIDIVILRASTRPFIYFSF